MRIHALESSGGLTYAEMGRFVSAEDPSDPAGTSDEAAALKDESGKPVANAARNTWVTETALSTALNVSYMAEQISLFGIVVGIALVLTGIGLVILALSVFGRHDQAVAYKTRASSRLSVSAGGGVRRRGLNLERRGADPEGHLSGPPPGSEVLAELDAAAPPPRQHFTLPHQLGRSSRVLAGCPVGAVGFPPAHWSCPLARGALAGSCVKNASHSEVREKRG